MSTKPLFTFKALTIICTDRWRSHDFYTQVLGATILPRDISCHWYQLGNLTFTLVPNAAKENSADFAQEALNMIYLEVDDIDVAEKHFSKNKVGVVQPSDGQMMVIIDPDGLPIEIWQYESLV